MLVIREEQMRVFEEIQLQRWLTDYLQSCYPVHAAELGSYELRELVTIAAKRARARGLKGASEIRKYLHVTFLLGREFETDDRTMWARRILDDEEQSDPAERVCALEEAVLEHLEADGAKTRGAT